jgi:purine-binding chemotaxis protein CheW
MDGSLVDAVAAADRQIDTAAAATAAFARDGKSEVLQGERYVLLSIASVRYAVLEAYVTELERVPKITPVPRVPAWVRGVTNLRGDILSVVDMRVFLGLEPNASNAARMLVVRLLTEEFATGLIVDGVDRIVTVPARLITPPASPLEGALAPYLSGMCVLDDQLTAVLDLDRLLRSTDIRRFEEQGDQGDQGDETARSEQSDGQAGGAADGHGLEGM